MDNNEYLKKFFTELERIVDGRGTRDTISTTAAGELAVRLGAGDWYWAVRVNLDADPIRAAEIVATSETYFPTRI